MRSTSSDVKTYLPPPPGLGGPPSSSSSSIAMATPKQIQELDEFMHWQDPGAAKEDTARKLLTMFPLQVIGLAVREKYGILPGGWREFIPAKLIQPPRPVSPASSSSSSSDARARRTLTDNKINEILDSEQRFLQCILALQKRFIQPLLDIFASENERDIQALGISHADTNRLFDQLPHLVRFSQTLLDKLHCVNLVRDQPVDGQGRAIHVGRAFVEIAPRLHVYAPAILCYQQSLDILTSVETKQQKAKRKSSSFSSRASLTSESRRPPAATFMSLWEEVSARTPELRGQQLNAVLITPMQRVPRYRLLLESLLVDCDHADATAVVGDALRLFSNVASEINVGLAKHQKLVGILGNDFRDVKVTGVRHNAKAMGMI